MDLRLTFALMMALFVPGLIAECVKRGAKVTSWRYFGVAMVGATAVSASTLGMDDFGFVWHGLFLATVSTAVFWYRTRRG